MGAEELVIERLLRELRAVVGSAAGAIMAAPAHDDTSATEVEALGRNAEGKRLSWVLWPRDVLQCAPEP